MPCIDPVTLYSILINILHRTTEKLNIFVVYFCNFLPSKSYTKKKKQQQQEQQQNKTKQKQKQNKQKKKRKKEKKKENKQISTFLFYVGLLKVQHN